MTNHRPEDDPSSSLRFNVIMASITAVMALVGIAGTIWTHTEIHGIGESLIAVIVVFAAMSPIPVYWHQKRRYERRDAALVIYWAVLLKAVVAYPILVAARIDLPTRDSVMIAVDRSLDVSVPALMSWAEHSRWIEALFNYGYAGLTPMLLLAIFLPALAGRKIAAQRFLLANAFAFCIAIPIFAGFPVIGPWWGNHFAPNAAQSFFVKTFTGLRNDARYLFTPSTDLGIITFPSFHVIWALLSARALWTFRWLRIPAGGMAVLVVISTMTTGWHYFADVLAGVVVALVAMGLTHALLAAPTEGVEVRSRPDQSVLSASQTHTAESLKPDREMQSTP